MILGHDFKYRIPEMDRLLGAAADMGIHFSSNGENISYPYERKFLVQTVTVRIGDTVLQLMASSHDFMKREVETV
jgi:hypothetical protein